MEINFSRPYTEIKIRKPNKYCGVEIGPVCDMKIGPVKASKPKLWYATAWRNGINLCSFLAGLPKHLIGVFFSDEIFELKKELAEAKEKIEHDRIGKKWLCDKFNEHVERINELEDKLETANRSNGQLLHRNGKLRTQVKELLKSKGLNGGNRG